MRSRRSAGPSTPAAPAIAARAYARLLATGEVDRHLRRTRREYRERRDRLVAALAQRLPACRVDGVAAGLHLLLRLPPGTDERRSWPRSPRGGSASAGSRATGSRRPDDAGARDRLRPDSARRDRRRRRGAVRGAVMARITLATVAEALGVSTMTVSNAYNRPEKLSAELRERVLAKAAELGYAGPDAVARSLRRGKTGVLGVVLGEALVYAFEDPATVEFFRGLAGAGIPLHLVPATGGAGDTALVFDAAVDAFILYALPDGHPLVDAAARRGLPVVVQSGPEVDGASVRGDRRARGGRGGRRSPARARPPAARRAQPAVGDRRPRRPPAAPGRAEAPRHARAAGRLRGDGRPRGGVQRPRARRDRPRARCSTAPSRPPACCA